MLGNRWITTYSHNGNHNNDSKQSKSTTKRRTATKKLPKCIKPGHVIEERRKSIRKEQERQGEKQTTKRPNAKTYPPCLHYQKTDHTADMCWKGPNADKRRKRHQIERTKDSKDKNHKPKTSRQSAQTSILKIPLR